ncbi:MAG: hypothetical protein A4E38_01359 [Methanoregulaceae archaeon PtaB.Bin108]|nr:MAG: hypothetical protein A4E38_01359 [Methanoregulaceae archaeon PtaB.Bin108]OPY46417.1 MAG: hypothetical protein A4E42_00528 [Methanoregulaceae archaeon PtaU1.Bin222]
MNGSFWSKIMASVSPKRTKKCSSPAVLGITRALAFFSRARSLPLPGSPSPRQVKRVEVPDSRLLYRKGYGGPEPVMHNYYKDSLFTSQCAFRERRLYSPGLRRQYFQSSTSGPSLDVTNDIDNLTTALDQGILGPDRESGCIYPAGIISLVT